MPILSFVKKRLRSKSQSCNFPTLIMDDSIVVGVKLGRSSIADKIAALQKKSENNWTNGIKQENLNENESLLDGKTNNKDVSSALTSRMNLLEKSQEEWKCRILDSVKKSAQCNKVPTKKSDLILTPVKSDKVPSAQPHPGKQASFGSESSTRNSSNWDLKYPAEGFQVLHPHTDNVIVRYIARNDNETFTQFFSPMATGGKIRVDDASFRAIQSSPKHRDLLGTKRNLRIRRQHVNTPNPVKSLAKRISATGQFYSEVKAEFI